MSSTNRRSNKHPIPSVKSNPQFPADSRHDSIASCKTALNTHPCRTPAVIRNFPFSPFLTLYFTELLLIQIVAGPCQLLRNPLLLQRGQMPSTSFDKSKLMTYTVIPTAQALSRNTLAVTKCSSRRRLGWKPCCASGWRSSNVSSILPNNM